MYIWVFREIKVDFGGIMVVSSFFLVIECFFLFYKLRRSRCGYFNYMAGGYGFFSLLVFRELGFAVCSEVWRMERVR